MSKTIVERFDDPTDHLYGLDNPERMRVLASIDFDHPDLRTALDAITARTADRLGLPISLVTLVLDTAQIMPGAHGVNGWIAAAGGTPVEWSFCAHTVAARRPYVITDAAADPVHRGNPLVAIDGARSYAGVPLIIDGQVLGAHCVIGAVAHTFTDSDLAELQAAAADISAVLQQHRLPLL
jgi:GAF domain-containing protein